MKTRITRKHIGTYAKMDMDYRGDGVKRPISVEIVSVKRGVIHGQFFLPTSAQKFDLWHDVANTPLYFLD